MVDVGGGNGTVLAALLARHPQMEGVVFDLPSVSGRGTPALEEHPGRWEAVGGNFFDGVPAGGDAYLLSHVIHDWSEERALTILRNCRAAMGSDGRLLIAEMIVPSGNEMHPAKMLDALMLVTLLTWGVYASFVGLRLGRRWHGRRSALLALAGFALVVLVRLALPVTHVS